MNNKVKINLSREEALACVIALDKEKKPYGWQQDALAKMNLALGYKPVRSER